MSIIIVLHFYARNVFNNFAIFLNHIFRVGFYIILSVI